MNKIVSNGVPAGSFGEISPTDLNELVPLIGEYSKARSGVFPSKNSPQYFQRHHGQRLIDEGIGLKIGNKLCVIPSRCDEYIIRILQRDGGFRTRKRASETGMVL